MRNIDLQDWQKAILKEDKKTFELKPQQKEMIERLLYSMDGLGEEYTPVLKRVLRWGWYLAEDKEVLNYARECYLKELNKE